MNKRISKKHLTEDEQLVLELYRQCQRVEFVKHRVESIIDATDFTNQLSHSVTFESNNTCWASSEKGKITVTAYLKKIVE